MSTAMSKMPANQRRVALVTLGCSRNEVDSEELAGRLTAAGWQFDHDNPDVVLVNTCGFIEQAKQESIDTLLEAADTGAKVVAVGCLAERYGRELATNLPEADAVLSFDDYAAIDDRLQALLSGEQLPAHQPRDRRKLLPISPAQRQGASVQLPGHATVNTVSGQVPDLPTGLAPASGPRVLRRRLDGGPVAPLKLASGCDRRCTFCAIPSFRGAFVSRPIDDVVAEAQWLAGHGVRELFLVSENSTSYGKDLANPHALEELLGELAEIDGILRVRVSYLQPAEMRPSLVAAIANTPLVAPYYDLSFQHASRSVLRRMRRFGGTDQFLELLSLVRQHAPEAGVRSNFIVGFPGETEQDVAELASFLTQARLDAIGIFAYSDEDGTEAASFTDKVATSEITARYDEISRLAEELTAQRADERIGSTVDVLIETIDGSHVEGRAAHQAPEVDGSVVVTALDDYKPNVGDLIRATVVRSHGVDLEAEYCEKIDSVSAAGL